jgi:hypothetical protein
LIPALPGKDARLKQPSKEECDAELLKLDNKIHDVMQQKKQMQTKRSEI